MRFRRLACGVWAVAVFVFALTACRPSTDDLLKEFSQRRSKYEELLAIAKEDPAAERIRETSVYPAGSLSADRWSRYKQLLRELNLEGIDNGSGSKSGNIYFVRWTTGQILAGTLKGFAHMPSPPERLVDSVDRVSKVRTGTYDIYQHIADDWYFMLSHS